MRVLEKRLRRLEEELLPPAQTEASRLYCDAMLEVARNRARQRGLRGWSGLTKSRVSPRSY